MSLLDEGARLEARVAGPLQPVEHLMSLRAIPNLWVVHPAGANDTAIAWRVALERRDGPVALVLTRQDVPVLDPDVVVVAERGAYVVREPEADETDLILLATGSEVSIALGTARLLEDDGIAARVVSMPCWELLAEQPRAYRETVLPPAVGIDPLRLTP